MEKEMGRPAAVKSRTGTILGVGVLVFILAAIAAWFVCDSRIQYMTQKIINSQRDLEQAHMSKSLDAIRVWRAEVVTQMRFVSSSEMFRLFIADTGKLNDDQLEMLGDPGGLHSEYETIRILAEQRAYIQDLLQDLTHRRAWTTARIVNVNGKDIVSENYAHPLNDQQEKLIREAIRSGHTTFGPLRESDNGIVMDVADPLFEVMGIGEPKGIAALLVTIPMERTLSTFLLSARHQKGSIYTRILDRSLGSSTLVYLQGNILQHMTLSPPITGDSLPFEEREGFVGQGRVYSMGGLAVLLNWLFITEIPANVIKDQIDEESWQIRSLGIGSSALIALVFAVAWALLTSRTHRQRSLELEKMNATIRQQKLMLDSINGSVQTGILLADDKGYIKVCNPAFCKICGVAPGSAESLPLAEVLRGDVSIHLISAMAKVRQDRKSDSMELVVPGADDEKRLYRINLFPYSALPGETATSGNGCVAIFQDITEFRASAERAKRRQEALISAMDRAVASVDPNLVGQSIKMAQVARLIADKINLDVSQKETLRLSAMLSQIGKLFVPKELLRKKGALTPEEFKEVSRAPEYADNILRDLHFGLPVQQTVREMNERMDGSGPAGMKGAEISVCGRVLAVASALTAMTSPRAWRSVNELSLYEAISTLGKDGRFDSEITAALDQLNIAELMAILLPNKNPPGPNGAAA